MAKETTLESTTESTSGYLYDVFISYSHRNTDWVVDELVPRFQQAGLKVCIDNEDFNIGVPVLVNIEQAVMLSRHTLLVLTPEWGESAWTKFESLLAAAEDVVGQRQRMLPLLLEPFELPARIRMLTYADFTCPERRDAEFKRLLRGMCREEPAQDVFPFFNEQITKSAREGTLAFAELVAKPKVRAAAQRWTVVFGTARTQVDLLANYKELHDALHRFEIQCHRQILQELKRFPDDDMSVDNLLEYEFLATEIIQTMCSVADRIDELKPEYVWIKILEQTRGLLKSAIDELDGDALFQAYQKMGRVLATRPTRINLMLSQAASRLGMESMIDAMRDVCEKIPSADEEAKKLVGRFEEGIEALEGIRVALKSHVLNHDQWQQADTEFRQLEADFESRDHADASGIVDLKFSWDLARAMVEPLVNGSIDEAAEDLKNRMLEFDMALESGSPVKVRRAFRLLRRQALSRFYQVDKELLNLCKTLQQIGEPLNLVWEMISHES